jgi:hypothetical protein
MRAKGIMKEPVCMPHGSWLCDRVPMRGPREALRRLEERIDRVERGGTRQVERLSTASRRVLWTSDNCDIVEGGKPGLDRAAGMRQDGREKGWNDRWAGTA